VDHQNEEQRMNRSIGITGLRRAVAGTAAGLLAVAGVLASAGAASAGAKSADTTLTIRYPVTGTTHLATPNGNVALGPGHLTATADLNTGAITANLKLPEATGSFTELGIVPVTATVQLINDGPTTGTLNINTGAVNTTSMITMRIVDLKVAGIDLPVGSACQTASPVSVPLASQPGFNILTYTIGQFANCGLQTLLINLTVPGSGNTISFTLGKGKVIT
jgi:hypothetical protein